MTKHVLLRLFFAITALFLLTNCSKSSSGSSAEGSSSGCTSGIPTATSAEISYCSPTSNTFSPSTAVTGTAVYEFRATSSSGLGGGVLSTRPIRFAEVRITNSSGSLVQCAETDNSGNFSFNLPQDGTAYTVSVNSRAANSSANVSVLDAPDVNNVYSLTTSVTTSGAAVAAGTITAEGRSSVLGGAFNIFDQIVKSQEFLKTETATCNTLGGLSISCAQYNPLSNPSGGTAKVSAFWKKGFNPNEYFCAPSSGLSFYVPSVDQLFILGGIDGDTDNSDTDHFDNSVIIHELAHFLEDQYAKTDSPGGSHDGNSVNDPRLMWSEGFANFFQAAVLNTPLYQDTSGNADGSTGNFFFENLEFRCQSGTSNDGSSCTDLPASTGEGNFREFSITRALWDAIDDGTNATNGDDEFDSAAFTDNFQLPFDELWTAFLNLSASSFSFRNVGLFHELVVQLTGTTTNFTNYQTLMTSGARHRTNRTDYPNPISSSTSCTTTISASGTNQFTAHDYYDYNHTATGPLALDLTHNDSSGSRDVDLYLYFENYTLFNQSSFAAPAANSENDGGTESISVTNLPAGRYLIDVHYFSGGSNQTYTLTLTNNANPGGKKVCPETSF